MHQYIATVFEHFKTFYNYIQYEIRQRFIEQFL